MKIALLTASLDPGCDGVGDYTHGIGAALTALGHETLLVSLHDARAAAELTCQDEVGVLRLSRECPWGSRVAQAVRALAVFDPEWVSLQFVPYGFQSKGLVLGLADRLAPLFAGRSVHLMCHELWIGESSEYGFKDRVVGYLQKSAVLGMIQRLQPRLVQTSNPAYRELLRRNGVSASELPLPGNIPVVAPEPGVLERILRERASSSDPFVREEWWVAGIFGTIHPQWSPENFLDQLCTAARDKHKRLLLFHLGRTPPAGEAIWQRLAARYRGRCDFLAVGALPSNRISALFQAFDFGIATSPWALIGKSGSATAMLDHGLPLVVPRDDWKLRRGSTPEPRMQPGFFRSGEALLQHFEKGVRWPPAPFRWRETAEQFVADLMAAPATAALR